MLLVTTASVLALPTSSEPPLTVYPKYEAIDEMRNANTNDFIIAYHTYHSVNNDCIPSVSYTHLTLPTILIV